MHHAGSVNRACIGSFPRTLLGLALGLAVAASVVQASGPDPDGSPQVATDLPSASVGVPERSADFGDELPSTEVRELAHWVAHSGDDSELGFFVIDKKSARLYVFDAAARLRAVTPVLLGSAKGDDSVPDIGARPMREVKADERTTPAGRFMAERGRNAGGEDVVWVDYDAAVSMHRVRATNPKERRLERLASETPDDNRISYGCINIPVSFYETYVRPAFAMHRGVVYVLPDVKSMQQVFGAVLAARLQVPAVPQPR